MKECKACESSNADDTSICETCGYDFDKKGITDADKLRSYVSMLKSSKNWISEVKLKLRVHEIQKEYSIYGGTLKYRADENWNKIIGRWNQRKTEILFGESLSQISIDIRLAKAMQKYPELVWKDCENKKQAVEYRKEYEFLGASPYFKYEKDLQEKLESDWDKTPFSEEWVLNDRSLKIETWEIDLLARHFAENRWMVIELKKGIVTDKAIGQISRYISWVKDNIAGKDEIVEGLIIAVGAEKNFKYALKNVQNINFQSYYLEDGDLQFLPTPFALIDSHIKIIRKEGLAGVIKYLDEVKSQSAPGVKA